MKQNARIISVHLLFIKIIVCKRQFWILRNVLWADKNLRGAMKVKLKTVPLNLVNTSRQGIRALPQKQFQFGHRQTNHLPRFGFFEVVVPVSIALSILIIKMITDCCKSIDISFNSVPFRNLDEHLSNQNARMLKTPEILDIDGFTGKRYTISIDNQTYVLTEIQAKTEPGKKKQFFKKGGDTFVRQIHLIKEGGEGESGFEVEYRQLPESKDTNASKRKGALPPHHFLDYNSLLKFTSDKSVPFREEIVRAALATFDHIKQFSENHERALTLGSDANATEQLLTHGNTSQAFDSLLLKQQGGELVSGKDHHRVDKASTNYETVSASAD